MPVKRPIAKQDILTNEVFVYEVYPQPSPNAIFSFDAFNVKLYKHYDKYYLVIKAELVEISAGSFNKALGAIAGMNDESAALQLTDMYNSGKLKKIKTIEETRKFWSHR